jgi:copper homeostasis protein (lipoprotein)
MKAALTLLTGFIAIAFFGCNNSGKEDVAAIAYKGVYSLGPEVKSFKDCETGSEFWVTGNCTPLEQEYNKLNFEKPYEPVYVEVEANKVKATKADALDAQYDSILVIKRLVKISKVIPQDMCN